MRSLISRNGSFYLRMLVVDSRSACNLSFYAPRTLARSFVKSIGSNEFLKCTGRTDYQRLYICSSGINLKGFQIADYEEIKSLPNNPEKLLVDVREKNELIETGKIPTSINIPLANVVQDLGNGRTDEEFGAKFARKKPTENTQIIFSCLKGKRAVQAAESALTLGYKNVKVYEGSWLDWSQRESLPK